MTTRRAPAVLLFDVNETLLDLAPLRVSVAGALAGRSELVPLWFTTLLHHSLVTTVAGRFVGFGEIAVAALQMVAGSHGLSLDGDAARAALAPITSLPVHEDVLPAFDAFRRQGQRLAVLTNSSQTAMRAQMQAAGLATALEAQFSVEGIGHYKPHPEAYRWAVAQLGVEPSSCMMVAAHGWDVAGASWAGLRTAFVARPGQVPYPLAPSPELVVDDLRALARALADAESAG